MHSRARVAERLLDRWLLVMSLITVAALITSGEISSSRAPARQKRRRPATCRCGIRVRK